MPGFNLPPPSALPPVAGAHKSAVPTQSGVLHGLEAREQHIRRLEMDNVRLQVKLDQAEKDVKTAIEMLLVLAGRCDRKPEGASMARVNSDFGREGRESGDSRGGRGRRDIMEESLLDLDDQDDNDGRGAAGTMTSHDEQATPSSSLQSTISLQASVSGEAERAPGRSPPRMARFKHLFSERDMSAGSSPSEEESSAFGFKRTVNIDSQSAAATPIAGGEAAAVKSEPLCQPLIDGGDEVRGGLHNERAGVPRDVTPSLGYRAGGGANDSGPMSCQQAPGWPRKFEVHPHMRSGMTTRHARRDERDEQRIRPAQLDVVYRPAEHEKNVHRSVIICNLPPQTDVADVVARARNAPLLWVKLLPTVGMKVRKRNGTVGTLATITALTTFYFESSAEQFVVDLEVQPLVIRGRTAVAKLLDAPTFPSAPGLNTYQGHHGRLSSRRVKFQQCGLVKPHDFEDVLAGRSVGYLTQGWIVDVALRREAGKNMVTVEFASVDTARWAYERLWTEPSFAGCCPVWVLDQAGDAGGPRRRCLTKTRDGEDCPEVDGFDNGTGGATSKVDNVEVDAVDITCTSHLN